MRKEVGDLARRLNLDEDTAFPAWYAKIAFGLDDEDALEAVSYGGGNDRGIDLIYADDEWETIVIGQSRYYKRTTKAPRPQDIAYLFNTLTELDDPQELRDAGRHDLADAAEELRDARARGFAVKLVFVYPGTVNDDIERLVRNFNRTHIRENVSADLVPLAELELTYEDYTGTAGRVPEGELAVVEDEAYFIQDDEPFGRSLVATIPGTALRKLYQEHGNRLFEQNVRLFLGTRKGSVNAGIRDTLNDPRERKNFWAYNNGISIVASSFEEPDGDRLVTLKEFSIVNGCQTTVSIGDASEAAARDAKVLARIMTPPPALVDNIIRYTNSQNPFAVWDISARDKVQLRLKRELAELEPPWFYAVKRGEFENLPNKDEFGPYGNRRVLPFPLSAQFLAALRGLPVEAYKDKARLFTAHKDKVFPSDVRAADVLWAWKVSEAVEGAIKHYRTETDPDETTDAILKRGARFFATAVAGHLLRLRNGPDVFAKVDVERLLDKKMRERLEKYALMAVIYYVAIMRDLVKGGSELGTLLKTSETAATLEQRVKERMLEDRLGAASLDEKLPLLPGIAKPKKTAV